MTIGRGQSPAERAMARPSPMPPVSCEREASKRTNGSNTRSNGHPRHARARRRRSRSAARRGRPPGAPGSARRSARRSRSGCARPGARPPGGRPGQPGRMGSSTSAPRSARSTHVLSTSAARSTTRVGSLAASSRAKASVPLDHLLHLVQRRQDALPVSSSSTNSARRRSEVIGVRRSWLIAASIRVRSSTNRCSRACIRLKAWTVRADVGRPSSGRGGGASPRPERVGGGSQPGHRPGDAAHRQHDAESHQHRRQPSVTRLGSAQAGRAREVWALSQRPSASCTANTKVTGRAGRRQYRGRPAALLHRFEADQVDDGPLVADVDQHRPSAIAVEQRSSWRARRLRPCQRSPSSTALRRPAGTDHRAAARRQNRSGSAGGLVQQPHQPGRARQTCSRLAARSATRRSSAKISRLRSWPATMATSTISTSWPARLRGQTAPQGSATPRP